MKQTLYVILFLLIHSNLYSQSTEMIVPFYNNGKWGFMNKYKDIVVCPKYEEAYPSASDRYRVKKKGKYGFINRSGKLVIKAKYDDAEDFDGRIALVTRKGKAKYITSDGKKNKVLFGRCGNHPCLRPKIGKSLEIIESNGKYGILHKRLPRDTIPSVFDTIVPISHQLMYLVKDSLISLLHQGSFWSVAEHMMEKLNFEYEDIELYNCNLCSIGLNEVIGIKKNGLWGYRKIYFRNEEYIKPKYLSINSLADGFALVEYKEGKFGYIDYLGNEYFIR